MSGTKPTFRNLRFVAIGLVCACYLVVSGPTGNPGYADSNDPDWTGETYDESINVDVVTHDNDSDDGPNTRPVNDGGLIVEYSVWKLCADSLARHDMGGTCPDGRPPITEYCLDGSEAQPPRWVRYGTPNPDGTVTWSPWTMDRNYYCPGEQLLLELINQAWTSMPIESTPLRLQPDQDWIYADIPLVASTEGDSQYGTYTLLGNSVTIRATPIHYTWHWGDGQQTNTRKPGSAWPNATITHAYAYREEPVTVQLTTTWEGHFSINGQSTWHVAPGLATTTESSIPMTLFNPRSHLVDCTTTGECILGAGS